MAPVGRGKTPHRLWNAVNGAACTRRNRGCLRGGHAAGMRPCSTEESTTAAFLLRARREGIRDFGACMAPFTAFQILQGMETLPLRMARHIENTRTIVDFLRGHALVGAIGYPGLPEHPDHALAERLLPRGAGSVFSFNLRGTREQGRRFIEALRLFSHLANVGDAKSLVIHPASTTHFRMSADDLVKAGITEGTIRLSVGLEDPVDLIEDFRACCTPPARPDVRVAVDGRWAYAYTGGRAPIAEAPTIVFVHGAAHDHTVWALQSRYLANHGRNVLALDLPGHGRSEGPAPASVEELSGWLARFIDAMGLDHVTAVGHSMGALVALEYAAHHPDRVAGLRCWLPPHLASAMSCSTRHAATITGPTSSSMAGRTARRHSLAQPDSRRMDDGHVDAPAGALRTRPACDRPGCVQWVRKRCCSGRRRRRPVLVIVGSRDIMAPARSAAALIEALPDKRVVALPDTGHALMAERPDAVLDALREFL